MSIRAALERALNESPAPEPSAPAELLRLRAGDTVYAQEERSDAVYLLLDGQVALTTVAEGAETSQTTLLLRAPAVLGDRDALLEAPSEETARTLSSARLAAWDATRFRDEYAQDAWLKELLAWDLAERYARTLALQRLSQWPLRMRVPLLLAELPPDVSADLVAVVCNTTAKSVTRVLADLRKASAAKATGMAFRPPAPKQNLFHTLAVPGAR